MRLLMPHDREETFCAGGGMTEQTTNEQAHREGRPHLRRLWGVVLCELCEGEPEVTEKVSGSAWLVPPGGVA